MSINSPCHKENQQNKNNHNNCFKHTCPKCRTCIIWISIRHYRY
nr:MAG TPA_asm: hypothetical protein [Caudoviricetes sp.]